MAEHAATQSSTLPVRPSRVGRIVVGCVLVVVLATALVFGVSKKMENDALRHMQWRAWMGIKNIQIALKFYYTKKDGTYPDTATGLRGLVEMQALEAIPRDPWSNEYTYLNEGGRPVVISYGPDGKLGGGDDISSNKEPEEMLVPMFR